MVFPPYIFSWHKSNWRTFAPCVITVLPHITCYCTGVCLPSSQRGTFLVGEDTRTAASYNMQKAIWQIQDTGMCNCFSFIPMNLRPWPFVTLPSITVTVQSKHSSDSLKHGFHVHRLFTTGQKKKKLLYQWDLHRLVRCKADITCYCRGFDSRPGRINSLYIKLASNVCGSELKHQSCSLTSATVRSAVGGSCAGAWGSEAYRLLKTYRPFERSYFLRNFSNWQTKRNIFGHFYIYQHHCEESK
jgi:hypothetical protein